jgi:hypothetical protein
VVLVNGQFPAGTSPTTEQLAYVFSCKCVAMMLVHAHRRASNSCPTKNYAYIAPHLQWEDKTSHRIPSIWLDSSISPLGRR